MSLIKARRSRKKSHIEARKGMPPGRLLVLFVVTLVVIWFAYSGQLERVLSSVGF